MTCFVDADHTVVLLYDPEITQRDLDHVEQDPDHVVLKTSEHQQLF
jgi:hypothetical protein